MTQQITKNLGTVGMAAGLILITTLVMAGGTVLRRSPNTWIDLLPKRWVSDEDKAALKDPKAANQKAYDNMCREAWENSKANQPPGGWGQGWKK